MLEPGVGAIEPSYAALLRVRGFGRVVLGTLLARLGGQMWEIVLVLFVLQRYRSPSAGTGCSIEPLIASRV